MTYYMSLYFFLFYWSIVDLQYCVSFRYTAKWFSYTCFFCIFFFILDYYKILHIVPCAIQLFLVQFSHSVMSNSLWPHESQHARPPCPSTTPRVYPNSCPLSQWCHPTMLSSVIPFSSCPQSFPASGSFQMSQLFASGGQNIGVSASTSVLPTNTQDWSPLE